MNTTKAKRQELAKSVEGKELKDLSPEERERIKREWRGESSVQSSIDLILPVLRRGG